MTTMIRINLIAERKAAAAKPGVKKPQLASDLQENIILIIFVIIAAAAFFGRMYVVNDKLKKTRAENTRKKAEYAKLEPYKERQLDYEIQKELLTEKIHKISDLKNMREGPVKLLEDIFNNLPTSIHLVSIEQGYDKRLAVATGKGKKVYSPGSNIGSPQMFKLTGYSKTIDAASTLANRLFSITSRITDGELNNVAIEEKEGLGEYQFTIFFKTKKGAGATDTASEKEG